MENQEKEGGGYIEHLTWISKNYSQVALSQFEEKSFKDAVFGVMLCLKVKMLVTQMCPSVCNGWPHGL